MTYWQQKTEIEKDEGQRKGAKIIIIIKKYTEKILKKKEKKARARPVVVQPWFSVNRGQESQKADILSRKKMDRLERDAKKNGWRLVQPDSCALRV